MSNVFIGGSRQISRLPAPTLKRLNNVMSNDFRECSSVVMASGNGLRRKEDWFSGTIKPGHGEKIAVMRSEGGTVGEQGKAGRD